MTKYVCWNAETGFSILDARNIDDAALQCEMDQAIGMEAVLLGEEEEQKEKMWKLLNVESLQKGIRHDALMHCLRHDITSEMLIKEINKRFEDWRD